MLFGEAKLTIMVGDPREVERRRFLGIDDSEAPSRDDLVDALVDVNEGRVPKDCIALQMLAEEMISWPNLEVEAPKKKSKSNSPYAKATDTGIDPKEAAKRLNIDWDSAAEIDEADAEDAKVPAAVSQILRPEVSWLVALNPLETDSSSAGVKAEYENNPSYA
ncbi:Ycf3-interacting protein 1, chloroplastic-like protein [Drosera capensis]